MVVNKYPVMFQWWLTSILVYFNGG